MTNAQALETFIAHAEEELRCAWRKHPAPFHSAHEAFAVLLEEIDEFKCEVWKKSEQRDRGTMLTELLHVAAMAARAAVELGLLPDKEDDNAGGDRPADDPAPDTTTSVLSAV